MRLHADSGICIRASAAAGAFRGLTTLRQMLPVAWEDDKGRASFDMPTGILRDAPRFEHRGLLLDCCRHFMSPEFVKKTIDLLALHKMNVLHWHLTEDQGWRIAIDAYPKLTEVGAWRTEANGQLHGGFYTKDQIREIVAYATERHVTVIPEIELPGHSRAAIAAYPWLSCTGDSLPVENNWGVFKDIYCAGEDTTFAFLERVLDEVMELFPSPYIHIGGDEAPKVRWEACPKCQKRMVTEGLHDAHELQSWFITRIGKYLADHGRKMIGWDEILEGGLPQGAIIQSWRGMEGGKSAVAAGADAIMSPTSHCYFDYPISATDMEEVYGFDPIPDGLEGSGSIRGGECNMWTEHAPQELVESKIYPRLSAMAEVLWSPVEGRDYRNFMRRMEGHFVRLDAWGVDYGLEGEPLDISWKKGTDPYGLEVTIKPALRGIEGDVSFVGYGAKENSQLLPLNQPLTFRGEGQLVADLHRQGRAWRDSSILRMAGHIGAFASISIGHDINDFYPGGGEQGLADGRLGSMDFRDGCWQAVQMQDMSVTLKLPESVYIDSLSMCFYRYQNAWIFLPESMVFEWSKEGLEWEERLIEWSDRGMSDSMLPTDVQDIVRVSVPVRNQANWVRFTARNPGPCPSWHDAASSPSWMFMDELVVHAPSPD